MNAQLKQTVDAAKNGDRAAFETLYNSYRDKLFFFAKKYTGSREAAEDVVSETFITAMEKLPNLREGEAFGGWLYSIAYSKCMDHCRENSERISLDDENMDAVINSPVMLPDDYAVSEQLKSGLRDIIDGLSPEARSAVIMYYYEEMSVEEVAKAMDITENAAKQRLFRARKTIRSKIEALVGKGGMFAAVPLGAVLNNTAELSPAAVSGSGAAVTTGTAKLAGTSFALKAAAVGAAAVMAVGIPVGLSKLSKNGDVRTEDSSAVERLSEDSSEDSSEYSPVPANGRTSSYALMGSLRAELDYGETKRLTESLTPAENSENFIFAEDVNDWLVSCSDGDVEFRYARVPSDKGWCIVDGDYRVYEDSAELNTLVTEAVTARSGDDAAASPNFSVECAEPNTEQEYVDAAVKCIDGWLTSLESSIDGLKGHEIAMTGESGSQVTNYLASGTVNGEKQFLAEICFNVYPESGAYLKKFWQEGRYTAAGKFWSGYYICGKFSYKDGRVALIGTGTRDSYDSMKQGLNGIITGGYKNFFEFARRDDLNSAIDSSFVPYGRVTVSKNLTQTMDGTAINVDIYASRSDSETADTYTAIWDKRAYIDGKATYSTGLYFTDGGTGHVPDTLPKDFRLTFDNYDGDGNPDFCCRYDADSSGTFYVLDSIQSDGRIFNLSGRAYSGGIYVAGCTDPSPRLQKDDQHRYIGWKTDGGRYYPTGEDGSEIQLDPLNMYSDRFYLPDNLKLYSADENSVTCFVWNNTGEPITTDGSYGIQRLDGNNWITEAEGLNTAPVTVAPREYAEITYDISSLKNRYGTVYRIVQKSGQLTGYGRFWCEGAEVAHVAVTAEIFTAGAHTGSFTVTDTGVSKTKITSASVNVDGREVPLIIRTEDNIEYSFMGGGLPDREGTYTLTLNGSIKAELKVVRLNLSAMSFDISAEKKGDNIYLTVTPSVDCTVEDLYLRKAGSSFPVPYGRDGRDQLSAGETGRLTYVNSYSVFFKADEDKWIDEAYGKYTEEDDADHFKQYGIDKGLSKEEFTARIKEMIFPEDGGEYTLVVTVNINGTSFVKIIGCK